MDPLSISASIAALMGLSFNLTKVISQYLSSVEHAQDEAQELLMELSCLATALGKVKRFLKSSSDSAPYIDDESVLFTTVLMCQEKLGWLQTKLENLTKPERRKRYRNLIWPLTKKEHIDLVERVRKSIQIFNLALTTTSCDIALKTAKGVSTLAKDYPRTAAEVTATYETVTAFRPAMDGILKDMEDLKTSLTENFEREILDWLAKDIESSTNHINAAAKREPGTCEWFTNSQEFGEWTKARGLLWLYGIRKLRNNPFAPPSNDVAQLDAARQFCGKKNLENYKSKLTYRSSAIIDAIKTFNLNEPDSTLAYFYFNFQETRSNPVVTVLKALIRHICGSRKRIPQLVIDLFLQYTTRREDPTIEQFKQGLYSCIRELKGEFYIVIDALDECSDDGYPGPREILLRIIKEMVMDHTLENIHILITSRNLPDIAASVSNVATTNMLIDGPGITSDIEKYIQTRLQEYPFKKLGHDLKKSIESTLMSGANGMFRWAECQLDMLSQYKSVNAIKKALGHIPRSLDETYQRILSEIPEEDVDNVQSIFKWLAFSKEKSLTLDELAVAATLRPSDGPIDPGDRLFHPFDAVGMCRGLVNMKKEDRWVLFERPSGERDVVRFAHFSALEYLRSPKAGPFQLFDGPSEYYIADSCLSLLLQMNQDTPAAQMLDENPLLDYAARHWIHHVRQLEAHRDDSDDDGDLYASIIERVCRLFSAEHAAAFASWLRLHNPDPERSAYRNRYYTIGFEDILKPVVGFPSPLYYAVLLRLKPVVRFLLDSGVEVYRDDVHYASPVQLAATHGDLDVLKWLVEKGADVNACGGLLKGSALGQACLHEHTDVIEYLLEEGADINKWTPWAGTPLESSIRGKNDEIRRRLIKLGANINAPGSREHGSILNAALEKLDSFDVAKELIEIGANVNAPGGENGSALAIACGKGARELVKSLLEEGAKVNPVRIVRSPSPLENAAKGDDDLIVQWLLDKGAEVNATGYNVGNSVLHFAVSNRNLNIIELLLSHGAQVNLRNHLGKGVINTISTGEKEIDPEIIKKLIEAGLDVNAFGNEDWDLGSPLLIAASSGAESVLQVLINGGANIDQQSGKSLPDSTMQGTALMIASLVGHYHIAKLLVISGADVNAKNLTGRSALQLARVKGHLKIEKLLLKYGANDVEQ